jgi:hypothetical protein
MNMQTLLAGLPARVKPPDLESLRNPGVPATRERFFHV